MNKPFFQLVLIHFREFYREPGILFWGIGFPVLMAWILGIAFTTKSDVIQNVALIENQQNQNQQFRSFLQTTQTEIDKNSAKKYSILLKDETFGNTKLVFIPTTRDQALVSMKRGIVAVIIEEKSNALDYQFDPKNPEARLLYMQLTQAINNSQKTIDNAKISPISEVGMRYIDFLVPGLLAMGIMNSCFWGVGYSLVDMRSKKLLRRLVATPMKKTTFLISMFAARFALGLIEALVLCVFVFYVFDIAVSGSILALFLIYIAGYMGFAGLSFFIASRTSKTQIVNAYMNALSMPMMFLSGVFFTYHHFPDWAILIIQKLPLTMLADSIRSIFVEGAGLKNIMFEFIALSSVGVIFTAASIKMYKWH